MLNAVLNGKAGRVDPKDFKEAVSWRQLYKTREDLLTSAFFTRFTYLSSEVQDCLLKYWLETEDDFTDFEQAEFWPSYGLPEGETGKRVEPDLLLSFDRCDVLIEVKAPQGRLQYIGQWDDQLTGYFEQDTEFKPLYFLAVGQVWKIDSLSVNKIKELEDKHNLREDRVAIETVKTIKWKSIAEQLYKLQIANALSGQDERILTDMLMALELYGVQAYEPKWSDFSKLSTTLNINVMDAWPKHSKSKEVTQ